MKKNRFFKGNRKYRKHRKHKNNNFNRFIISQFNKLVIAIIILIILLLLKFININLTNNIIQIIQKGVNYEFSIGDSKETLKKYGARFINMPEQIVSVFTNEDRNVKFQSPIKGAIYKPFGEVRVSDEKTVFNNGIDIIPEKGEEEVLTVSDGRVLKIEDKKNKGFTVIIAYDNYKFVYGHLVEVYVEEGEEVREGQKIGTLGHKQNGNKYLHFEIWQEDKPIDPKNIINIDLNYN